jgi:hypothetical protein
MFTRLAMDRGAPRRSFAVLITVKRVQVNQAGFRLLDWGIAAPV